MRSLSALGTGLIAAMVLCLAAPMVAHAQDDLPPVEPMTHICDGTYTTAVIVDGYQRDWEEEVPDTERVQQLIAGEYRYDWTGGNDASFRVWCRYSDTSLYFIIQARDNAIVDNSEEAGDRMELWFELGSGESARVVMIEIPAWPALTDGIGHATWGLGGEGEIELVNAEIAERPDSGYFMEIGIPFLVFGDFMPGFSPMRFAAVQRDWDLDADREREVAIGTADVSAEDTDDMGTLEFTGAIERLSLIRQNMDLDDDVEPALQMWADVGGDATGELVMILDGQLIVTGENLGDFSYLNMNVATTANHIPISLDSFDIDHDGKDEIIYRYSRERTSLETDQVVLQEFLAFYDMDGPDLTRVIHQEVANEIEGGRIEMELDFRDRGHRTLVRFERGDDDELSRGEWVDVDERLDRDYTEILTPWGGQRRISYYLEDNGEWIITD